LGIHLAAGHFFVPEEDRAGSSPAVILSHRLWQSWFGGDPAVVGRTIALDNQRYTVTGVLPADFRLLRWPDLWMPIGQYGDDLTEHIHHAFIGVARLKPGVTLAQARDEMARLNQQETIKYPDSHKFFGVLVELMEDPSAAKLQGILLVLSGAVGLVLLIACANIVTLLLVRNAGKEREVAVRTLRSDLAAVLKQGGKGTSGPGRHRTHNALVISEIAMALVPLMGAGLLLRSFQHLLEVDPGFRVDHILTMDVEQVSLPFTQ